MRIGSLVHVKERRGCSTPPITVDYGVGVVVEIHEKETITLRDPEKTVVDLGTSVTVLLAGEVRKKFHHTDIAEVFD